MHVVVEKHLVCIVSVNMTLFSGSSCSVTREYEHYAALASVCRLIIRHGSIAEADDQKQAELSFTPTIT